MSHLELIFASGETSLMVHRFSVREAVSSVFEVTALARSESPAIDLQAIVGQPAALRVTVGYHFARGGTRTWKGVVRSAEQVRAVAHADYEDGLSTYQLAIVPTLWLLTQRRNNRIFQHLSIPDIVGRLLGEWGIEPACAVDAARYPKLEYKAQYGETRLRLRQPPPRGGGHRLHLPRRRRRRRACSSDRRARTAPTRARAGATSPSSTSPEPGRRAGVRHRRPRSRTRSGPARTPSATTTSANGPPSRSSARPAKAAAPEEQLRAVRRTRPARSSSRGGQGAATRRSPTTRASRATTRRFGDGARASASLDGSARAQARRLASRPTRSISSPGGVFSIGGHPHAEHREAARAALIDRVQHRRVARRAVDDQRASAVFADDALPAAAARRRSREVERRAERDRRGPAGQEIHTDEFGRVRVQFPWDREGQVRRRQLVLDARQPGLGGHGVRPDLHPPRRAGGAGRLPRAATPISRSIVGRVFNAANPVPYKLPDNKTRSTWQSNSSPAGAGPRRTTRSCSRT